MNPTIITGSEIRTHFGCEEDITDQDYMCPSFSWIRRTSFPDYRKFLKEFEIRYEAQISDCDEFSIHYLSRARALHSKYSKWRDGSLAVGECWYYQDAGGYHAINCAFAGQKKKLIFIEPQVPKIIDLSRKEIKSIDYVRF